MSSTRRAVVRDRATSRFLADGAEWSLDASRALVLDQADAAELVRRFACEPLAAELVDADDLGLEPAEQAVA